MTFARLAIVILFALGACNSDPATPDAAVAHHDAPHSGDAPVVHDAPAGTDASGVACTGALYDGCTSNAHCTSGNCKLFNGSNLEVCTQTCTPGDNTTCPMQNGQVVTCNNMGICKPPAANACTPQ